MLPGSGKWAGLDVFRYSLLSFNKAGKTAEQHGTFTFSRSRNAYNGLLSHAFSEAVRERRQTELQRELLHRGFTEFDRGGKKKKPEEVCARL